MQDIKDQLRTLIANGHTSLVLTHLKDVYPNDILMLQARWNSQEKQYNLGLIEQTEWDRVRNQINWSLLQIIAHSPRHKNIETLNMKIQDDHETALTNIFDKCRRRHTQLAEESIILRNELRNYNDQKSVGGFDVSGRRFKALEEKLLIFYEKVDNTFKDKAEDIVQRVKNYLEEPVPTYENLYEAYKLVFARGFRDSWVEGQFELRPNDDEGRITIAERIEQFLNRL